MKGFILSDNSMSVTQISAKDLSQKLVQTIKPYLLDVREVHEFEYSKIEGSQNIPLSQIYERIQEIEYVADCVVICHHGIRSQHVAELLYHSGFSNIFNLSGGIDAWSVECDNSVSRY